jgi:predicted permease
MSFRQGLVHASRSLTRAPLFSASVILTLTVGIGSSAAIFAVVNAVLLRPLPYGHPDRLVGAWHDMPAISMVHAQQTAATYRTYKRFAHTITDISLYQEGSVSVGDPDGRAEPERMSMSWQTPNLIPLLEVTPILGRNFTAAEDAPKAPLVALISEGLWKTRYAGDKNVLGKRLLISGQSAEIVGVMPESFRFPSASTRLWVPIQLDPNDPYPGGFNYNSIARLKPGVTVADAQRDFAQALPRVVDIANFLAPGVTMKMVLDQARPVPHLIPLRDDVVGEVARTLWIVAATAVLVLLVTCANVANLLLVRADGRQRELSVRAALGAGTARVLTHFFAEAALLAVVSGVLGLGLAAFGIHALTNAGPTQIPRLAEVHVDIAVVVFTVTVALLVAIACSAIPAIRFVRSGALSGLRDGGRGGTVGGQRQRARAALVAAQMAFALVVLATSGLLMRSVQHLRAVRPGFDPDGVATLWISAPTTRYATNLGVEQFYEQIINRVRQLPGIEYAGVASHLPLTSGGMDQDPFYIEGDASTANKIPPLEMYTSISGDYLKAMRIPLIAGRMFHDGAQQRGDEAIISQEVARLFFHDSTGRSALNKRFRELPSGSMTTIVGVVGSVRDTSLSAAPSRSVYYPEVVGGDSVSGGMRRTMAIVARTKGDVAATTREMQRVVRELDPTLPTFDVRSMRATVDGSTARLTFTMVIISVAAAVTLVLSIVGLYGVIAYVVTLRTRELGVRIALGAQPSAVAAMVTRQGMTLCGVGLLVGFALVAISSRFVRSFLYEVAPTDPIALGAATAVLVLFAIVASWAPARRAARVNPIEALRAD